MGSIGVVDIIIAAIILISAFAGFKKGFFKQVGGIVAFVGAIVLAVMFYKAVAGYIAGFKFMADLESKIFTWISSKGEIFSRSLQEVGEEGLKEALTALKLPEVVQGFVLKGIDMSNLPDKSIAEFMAPLLFKYICYAAAFLIIFILVWIIALVIVRAITKVVEVVPGISFLNRLLGFAVGGLKVLVFFWAIFYGLSFLTAVPAVADKVNGFVDQYILSSTVGKLIYDNNLIIMAISYFTHAGENAEPAEEALKLFFK